MRGRLLGPFEVSVAGRTVPLPGAKPRAMLATLLLDADRIVPVEQLTASLWDTDPPPSATANLRTYASTLRRLLAGDDGMALTGSAVGYRLAMDPADCDAHLFTELVTTARGHAAAGRTAEAVEHLERGLRLWRADAGIDLAAGPVLRSRLRRLDEQRADAVEEYHRLRLRSGDCVAEQIDELRFWTGRYPLRERLWDLLIRSLDRVGRPAEALAAYLSVYQILRDELGIEPSPELQELQRAILRKTPSRSAPPEPPPPRPRQLPAAVPAFVGRDAEARRLVEALGAGGGTWVVAGPGGAGKSTLAVHVGHRLAGRFPDGQLYVDLRGATEGATPLAPATVLARFLRACGVPATDVPTDEAELVTAYRSALAGRRMLVVLDDARDAAQVRPLLPGTAGSAVLVTSRRTLGVLPGVRHVHLGELAPEHAVAMLDAVVGDGRVAADPDGAARLAGLCGHLPLALAVAAARLVSRPQWTPSELAGHLADEGRRISILSEGDLALRSSFAVGYAGIAAEPHGPVAALAFRHLGRLDVPAPDLAVAAAMLDRPAPAVRPALDLLADARLVESPAPDRYRLHDLLRAYARELSGPDGADAVRRALRHYVAATRSAVATLRPGIAFSSPVDGPPGPIPAFGSPPAAVEWLDTERANLVAATVAYAGDPATAALSVALGEVLNSYLGVHGHFADWGEVVTAALAAARAIGDGAGEGRALSAMAGVHLYAGDLTAARDCLDRALVLAEAGDDVHAKVRVLTNLATVAHGQQAFDDALSALDRAWELSEGDDPQSDGILLNNIGSILLDAGRPVEAVEHLRSSLDLFERLGDPVGSGLALANLGRAYAARHDHRAAVEIFDRCLTLARASGDRQGEYDTLIERATVNLATDRPADARADAEAALSLCRAAGDREAEARARRLLEVS